MRANYFSIVSTDISDAPVLKTAKGLPVSFIVAKSRNFPEEKEKN